VVGGGYARNLPERLVNWGANVSRYGGGVNWGVREGRECVIDGAKYSERRARRRMDSDTVTGKPLMLTRVRSN